mgnify:CR=1 FL=1
MQVIKGAIIGSLFSAIILGLSAGVIVVAEDMTGPVGLRTKDFWWLAFIFAFIFGLISGGIEAALIAYIGKGMFLSILVGILFVLTISGIIAILVDGDIDVQTRNFLLATILVCVLNATLISIICNGQRE